MILVLCVLLNPTFLTCNQCQKAVMRNLAFSYSILLLN